MLRDPVVVVDGEALGYVNKFKKHKVKFLLFCDIPIFAQNLIFVSG